MNKNRLVRIVAKEVPSRKTSRVYAARRDLLHAVEELERKVSKAHLPADQVRLLKEACGHARHIVDGVSPEVSHATSMAKRAIKDVTHLSDAVTWLNLAERARVSGLQADGLRDSVEGVLSCILARAWNGELLSATTRLREDIQTAA